METQNSVLLTGSTGFVGMELLAGLLERTELRVYALVRAADRHAAAERLRRTVRGLVGGDGTARGRVVPVAGDITKPGLGLGPSLDALTEDVGQIVHGAASVSFELGLDESRATNVEGTRRMLELAALCHRRGGLRAFSYISTAYVAGTHAGAFAEDQLDVGQSFRNPYELSKFEAERLVRSYAQELPVRIFRPSIVVGDRRTGWTQSFNVLYGPLRAFARGAYAAVPARRSAPVDVVSVDYVADAILALSQAPGGDGATYHLTAGDDASTVGELIDLAAETFDRPPPVSVPPALYRRFVHPFAVRASGGRRRRMLERSEAYFPYFAVDTVFDDAATRAALGPEHVRRAPLWSYFDRLVDFAVRADWGRRPVTRREAREVLPR